MRGCIRQGTPEILKYETESRYYNPNVRSNERRHGCLLMRVDQNKKSQNGYTIRRWEQAQGFKYDMDAQIPLQACLGSDASSITSDTSTASFGVARVGRVIRAGTVKLVDIKRKGIPKE